MRTGVTHPDQTFSQASEQQNRCAVAELLLFAAFLGGGLTVESIAQLKIGAGSRMFCRPASLSAKLRRNFRQRAPVRSYTRLKLLHFRESETTSKV